MFDFHRPQSAYLVRPSVNRHRPTWDGFRTGFVEVKRRNPRLLQRSLMALAIWCMVVGSIQSLHPVSLTGAGKTSGHNTSLASNTAGASAVQPAVLMTAIHANTLPDGPTGQLLPPGSMAPDKTFKNTYAYGQCTWYVAGRRQIPPNWGNARSWYYNATAKGWSVGTVPAVAAIAWTNAGYYGHVALVEQVSPDAKSVYISEMNYRGIGVKSYRWVPTSQFKYIY